MSETVAVAGELYTSMSSFSQMTGEAAAEVLILSAAMERAGLATKDFGQITDLAMKGFGMSATEAQAISLDLLGVSQQLQVPLSQLGSDFTSSMAELAKHGPKGIEVFKELSAMSKAAGVEMNTLLGVAKGFDTIEGAAEKTSRLNAILGSTLNTVQMLNATESERIMLIKQSIDATGQSFGSMDRFKQQAIANAAGITNMADANKLFNTSGAEFEAQMAKLTGEAGDLSKATSAATSIGEKLKLIVESLAVAVLPLISVISSLLELLVLLLTPVNMLFNGLSIVGTKMGELTGLGQKFGDNVTAALFLISGALIYTTYQALTLGLTMGEAFSAGLLQSMKMFSISIYKNVIAPLGAGIMAAGRFALTMLTSVAGGLATAASSAIFFGASLLYDVVFGLAAATKAAYLFMLPFLPAIVFAAKFIAIAAAIAAVAYLIYDNWEFLVSWFTGALTSLGDFFVSLGDGIMNVFTLIGDAFKGFLNLFISGINFMIGALNSISFTVPDWVPLIGGENFGINIPLIPMLENGADIEGDGMAYLHSQEMVVTAAQTKELDDRVETASDILATVPTMATAITNPVAAMASIGAGTLNEDSGGLITALTEAIKTLAAGAVPAPAGQQATQVPVILQINERQLGKVMIDTLNNKQSVKVLKT
jgi:hypothetical protein